MPRWAVVGARTSLARLATRSRAGPPPGGGSEPLFTPIFTPQSSAPQAKKLTRRDPVAGAARTRATFATYFSEIPPKRL